MALLEDLMQSLTKALEAVGEAAEAGRRAFGQLATEVEILEAAYRQMKTDVAEGLKRERELLDILKSRGLASDVTEPDTTTGGPGEEPTP